MIIAPRASASAWEKTRAIKDQATTQASGQVGLACVAKDGFLPRAIAVRLGLIADELITSALRHGFPHGHRGRVAVAFSATPDAWLLSVADDGIDRHAGSPTIAGVRIAAAMTALLGGELELVDMRAGTRCLVTLPGRRCATAA